MKKNFKNLIAVWWIFFGLSVIPVQAVSLKEVVERWEEKGLTRFSTVADFMPYQGLRRDESTKFLVQYAHLIGYRPAEINSDCSFSDLSLAWQDLIPYIQEACELGIMKGSRGKVMPDEKLTNEQIVAMVMRIAIGFMDEENSARWSDEYYDAIKMFDVNTYPFTSREAETQRGNVLTLLYEMFQGKLVQNTELDKKLQELLDLLNED